MQEASLSKMAQITLAWLTREQAAMPCKVDKQERTLREEVETLLFKVEWPKQELASKNKAQNLKESKLWQRCKRLKLRVSSSTKSWR